MDLLDLMASEDDLREKALDRLEGILALFDADEDEVQDEALARAISLCGNEWGSYKAGLEELAKRHEARATADPIIADMEALRLREEAEDPGAIIRAARRRRLEAARTSDERAAVIARYGSWEAAIRPSVVERMFIDAAAHLVTPDPTLAEDNGASDPDIAWAPLAGWLLPWHQLPAELVAAVTEACPLPTTLGDARAEVLAWEERKHEREVLADGPGSAVLPTACMARHRLVEDLWRCGLPVRNAVEFEARLEYWATRGGDDGTGYAVLQRDLAELGQWKPLGGAVESTKDKARRLKTENPGWSLAQIGKELGISRQAVHKHLKP